jgi:cytochrome c
MVTIGIKLSRRPGCADGRAAGAGLERLSVRVLLAAGILLLAACDPVQPRRVDQADTPAVPAAPDLERGEVLSQACHPLTAGADAIIGPTLNGLFGRPSASVPDFAYSDALRQANLVWTPELLDAWLSDPADFLPGNNMAFAGYRAPADRRDLIAFLLEATRPPADGE